MITLLAFAVGYAATLAVDLALIIAGVAFAAEALWWGVRRRLRGTRRA